MMKQERMSTAQFRAMLLGGMPTVKAAPAPARGNPFKVVTVKPPKEPKYKNKRVQHAGMTFDSKKELERWHLLCRLQAAGAISGLRRQVYFQLAPAADIGEARKKPAIRYQADHVYWRDGVEVVEDVKSDMTRKLPEYRIKKHLMVTVHGILIKEV